MDRIPETDRITPPGIVIPLEWLGMLEGLTHQQAGQAIVSILTYGATGAVPDFTDPTLQMVWRLVQPRLDRDRERYRQKVERSRAYKERQAAQSADPAAAPRRTARTASPSRAEQEAATAKWV